MWKSFLAQRFTMYKIQVNNIWPLTVSFKMQKKNQNGENPTWNVKNKRECMGISVCIPICTDWIVFFFSKCCTITETEFQISSLSSRLTWCFVSKIHQVLRHKNSDRRCCRLFQKFNWIHTKTSSFERCFW